MAADARVDSDSIGRPVIGISACSAPGDYVESVRRAGGEPRLISSDEASAAQALAGLDGLVLTGGADIDPRRYGADRHPACVDAEPGRDEFEIELARRAVEADLPVLAICRGLQVLNVALGGTLVQDIPSAVPSAGPHDVRRPRDAPAHEIAIEPGTALMDALGGRAPGGSCTVNSRHHQSIERLGDGLRVSATAPDGIVEAVERPGATFCVGVQWHPENFWRTGEFDPLFATFIAAAVAPETRARS
jgi:putative glutamine amidotransferase